MAGERRGGDEWGGRREKRGGGQRLSPCRAAAGALPSSRLARRPRSGRGEALRPAAVPFAASCGWPLFFRRVRANPAGGRGAGGGRAERHLRAFTALPCPALLGAPCGAPCSGGFRPRPAKDQREGVQTGGSCASRSLVSQVQSVLWAFSKCSGGCAGQSRQGAGPKGSGCREDVGA